MESNNEECGQGEGTSGGYTKRRGNMIRESTDRKRNEKHKCKNEENQNGSFEQGDFRLTRNNKNEIKYQEKNKEICFEKNVEKTKRMRQKKRDILWKEIETEGKWQKSMKQTDFWGKKRNDYKKGEQGDPQKENRKKKTNHKRPNKKKFMINEEKRSKRRR